MEATARASPPTLAYPPTVPELSLAEKKRKRLLEMAVSAFILAVWGVIVTRPASTSHGTAVWLLWSVGPVAVLQLCWAGWKYVQLRRDSG